MAARERVLSAAMAALLAAGLGGTVFRQAAGEVVVSTAVALVGGVLGGRQSGRLESWRQRGQLVSVLAPLAGAAAALGWLLPAANPLTAGWLVAVALGSWVIGREIERDLESSGNREDSAGGGEARRRVVWRAGIGWFVLLALAAAGETRGDGTAGVPLALAGYSLAGIALLAGSRYGELRRQWTSRAVVVAGTTGRRWLVLTLVLLAGAVLTGLAASAVAGPALQAIDTLAGLLRGPAHALGGPIPGLLERASAPTPQPPPPPLRKSHPLPRPRAHHAGHAISPLDYLLVGAVLLMTAYLLYAFWRSQRDGLRVLLDPWRALDRWLRRLLVRAGERLVDGLAGSGERRLFGPLGRHAATTRGAGADDERRRVLHLYLAVLQRAARHGLPRYPAETPVEYGHQLESHLDGAWPEMERLTALFLAARYTRHPITEEDVRRAVGSARKVRAALRALEVRGD